MKPNRLKTQAKKPQIIPQDRDACAETINSIGRLQREIAVKQAAMNDEIALITDRYTGQMTEQTLQLRVLQEGVQIWCESNRSDLTEGGKTKTAGFVTGTVQWRQRPPRVQVRGLESVLETIKGLNLWRFIRTKEELNKEAILNDPTAVAGVPGLVIVTGEEEFVITPFEQELS